MIPKFKYIIFISVCLIVIISTHLLHAMISQTIKPTNLVKTGTAVPAAYSGPKTVASSSPNNANLINLNKYYNKQAIATTAFIKNQTVPTPQYKPLDNKTISNFQQIAQNQKNMTASNWNWKNWLTFLGIGLGLSEFISELYDDLVSQKLIEVTLKEIEDQAVEELQMIGNASQEEINEFVSKIIAKLSNASESASTLIFLLELVKKAHNNEIKKKIGIAITNNLVELGDSFCKDNDKLVSKIVCEKSKKHILNTLKQLIQLDPNSIITSTVFAVLKSTKPYALIMAKFIPAAITGNIQFKILSSAISSAPYIQDQFHRQLVKYMQPSATEQYFTEQRGPTNWRTLFKNTISNWWNGK